jgi:small-conductance mechanosensitive channel
MYDFALNAHSGLRYLVLLLAVVTALYALVGMMQKKPVDRAGLILLRIFTGTLDLQMLLGIVTLITGRFYPQLIGHIVVMVAAIAVAHLGAKRLKDGPVEQRTNGRLLATALIPLALVIAGILAIQRPIV